jgi:hypothetical protein
MMTAGDMRSYIATLIVAMLTYRQPPSAVQFFQCLTLEFLKRVPDS